MDDYKKKNLIGLTHTDEKNGDIIRSVRHVCVLFWGQTLDTPFENCYLSSKHLLCADSRSMRKNTLRSILQKKKLYIYMLLLKEVIYVTTVINWIGQ